MKLQLVKGTTSQRVAIFVQDSSSTTGAGLTGLLFSSAGLAWRYWREDEGNVGSTAVTLATATRGTYASGGFIEKDATNMQGFYEISIPDAALATGADWVVMVLRGATNMAPLTLEIQLTDLDMNTVMRGTDSAATAANLATVQSDTDDIQTRLPASLVGGAMDCDVSALQSAVITAASIATDAIGSAEVATTAVDKIRDAILDRLLSGNHDTSDTPGALLQIIGDSISELAQAAPSTTPTPVNALMLLYMALLDRFDINSTFLEIHNNAGTVIAKKALTDDGTTYSEANMETGP